MQETLGHKVLEHSRDLKSKKWKYWWWLQVWTDRIFSRVMGAFVLKDSALNHLNIHFPV